MKIYTSYDKIQNELNPGDVIAFVGNSKFCNLIKSVLDYPISHVGIILSTKHDEYQPLVKIIESGLVRNFDGVSISNFNDRVIEYFGEIFVLKLNKQARKQFDNDKFYSWLIAQEGKPYDVKQCISLGLKENTYNEYSKFFNSTLLNQVKNTEDYNELFCSELVAGGLKVANVLPTINPSEVSPKDLCSYKIFEQNYYQIKGNPLFNIDNFNTIGVK